MSVHITSAVWKMQVGNDAAKIVLLKLADSANDDGVCWPSQRTIARDCECSQSTVSRQINYLTEKGLLAVERPGNRTKSAVYRVLILRDSSVHHDESGVIHSRASGVIHPGASEPSRTVKNRSCTHKNCEGKDKCSYDDVAAVPMPKAEAA